MGSVALAASAIQEARDELAVLEAMSEALDLLGLNAQIALFDTVDEVLIVRRQVVPRAAQAQMDAIHGGTIVGMRVSTDRPVSGWASARDGVQMHAVEAFTWIVRPARDVEPARIDAVGRLIGLGEAYLTPITDGREVFGLLTIWAPKLERRDRAAATILGRLAGAALAAQQASGAAPAGDGLVAPGRPARAPERIAA